MWTLKVVKGADLADKLVVEVRLPQPLQRFTIGRDPGNGWAIADHTLAISARHCEIVDTPAGPALRDLSTNGTFVNGAASRMAGDHLLRDGDCIELGPYGIQVCGPPAPDRPAAAAALQLATSPRARSADVMHTVPHRGGDPAAMLAMGGGGERMALTEILRAAAPLEDSGLDMTRIREAPPTVRPAGRAAAAPATAAADTAAAAAPAVSPAPAVVAARTAWPPLCAAQTDIALAEALARGLGVSVQTLQGRDLLLLVEQLAAAVRQGQLVLRGLPGANDQAPAD